MKFLHLVTDRSLIGNRSLSDVVEQAVQGGVTHVQLREKSADEQAILEIGRQLKTLLDRYQVPLIINDHVGIAKALDAAGVHVGQEDMPYVQAREILGPQKIIGLSVTTLEEAKIANQLDVDYLGVGPIFSTTTKLDAAPVLGMQRLREIKLLSRHSLIAIGGITHKNCVEINALVDGVAVVSALCAAPQPKHAAMLFRGHLCNI